MGTIAPVTTPAGGYVSLSGGPSGEVLEIAMTPSRCTSDLLGCGPVPDSCSGQISELAGSRLQTIFTAPDSIERQHAVASPDRQQLAMIASPCTTGMARVLVRTLSTGTQTTIASVPRCSTLGDPAWSDDGRQIMFTFAPAQTPASMPAGVCTAAPAARLAIVSATRPSPRSRWMLIAADRGCSYEAATFDASGIAAVEGCSRANLPDSIQDPSFGQAVLVEINDRHQITGRVNLQLGWEQGVITTEPSGDVLISQDQPANEPYPERDWVWELHNDHLRLIASYHALDAAEIIAIPR